MEYVIGSIELPDPPPRWQRPMELVVRPPRAPAHKPSPVDCRDQAVLERYILAVAEQFPQYVQFGDGPPGYRQIGPGHYRR